MIISRTPLRIPFFSGGSDIGAFCKHEMGAAISLTINKYVYVSVHKHVGDDLIVNGKYCTPYELDPITREVLKHYKIGGISINVTNDINQRGTGLGSSSAYTVGLINAIEKFWSSQTPHPRYLAELACDIEINQCKFPIGKQDQYAAAYGGLNMFYFHTDGNVSITELQIPYLFTNKLYLVNTNITRDSSETIVKPSSINMDSIRKGRDYAYKMFDLLNKGNIDNLGNLLDDAWTNKKQGNSKSSNPTIDVIYDTLVSASSKYGSKIGGKVLGAGGGGFMLFYVSQGNQFAFYDKVKDLKDHRLSFLSYESTDKGSEIIYSDK